MFRSHWVPKATLFTGIVPPGRPLQALTNSRACAALFASIVILVVVWKRPRFWLGPPTAALRLGGSKMLAPKPSRCSLKSAVFVVPSEIDERLTGPGLDRGGGPPHERDPEGEDLVSLDGYDRAV